jgi:aspartate/methionine/tyrosine aminotransferase
VTKHFVADGILAEIPARISGLPASQIADIADLAREDPSVIKLWIGEGDLPTPDFISAAATKALRDGHTRYTYSRGIPALHRALADYHRRHFGVEVASDRFTVTPGGVNAIMQCLQAILEPGDEVIMPVPAWPNTMEIVRILGGKVVPVPYRTDTGRFRLELDDLYRSVGPRTKVIAINSPSNPTGWIMRRDQMIALRDFVRERRLWLLSDEVYNQFDFEEKIAPSFLEICDPTDRLLVTNTFSKNWCMTGWRMGWAIFPQGMAQVFDNLSQYNSTSVATFLQYGAIAALDDGDAFVRSFVARTAKARDIICSALDILPGTRVLWPQGTFYFFFAIEGMNDGNAIARSILRKAHVGVAPGSAFGPGGEEYLRICYAVDPALIEEASHRLGKFMTQMRPS